MSKEVYQVCFIMKNKILAYDVHIGKTSDVEKIIFNKIPLKVTIEDTSFVSGNLTNILGVMAVRIELMARQNTLGYGRESYLKYEEFFQRIQSEFSITYPDRKISVENGIFFESEKIYQKIVEVKEFDSADAKAQLGLFSSAKV